MNLDSTTLQWLWLSGILSLVLAIPALLGFRLLRQTALQHWWLGLLAMLSAAVSAFMCQKETSHIIKISFENFAGVLSFALMLDAVLRMNNQKLTPLGLWLPPLAVALAQVLQPQDSGSRVMLFCFVVCGQLFACTVLSLLPNREISLRSRAVLAAGFLFGGQTYAVQAWTVARRALSFEQDIPLVIPTPLVLQSFCFLLLTSVLFVLLELERNDSQGRRLATLDGLTGIYNRRTLLELGQRELASAQRHRHPLAVLMIDVDGLRRINEENGAFSGDRVLVHLAEQLNASLQRQDLFGRIGSDKFCAVLTETGRSGALHVAERIRARIESSAQTECGTAYTISIGVSLRTPSELGITQTIARAEVAMQRAHRHGNRIEVDMSTDLSRAELSSTTPPTDASDQ
jgi:diguanylate cyclase (GGDEF)-like protein